MKFTTLSMLALSLAGIALSQGTSTTLTTMPCSDPDKCSPVHTPTRSNIYTFSPTTPTAHNHESSPTPSPPCIPITALRSAGEWSPPLSTHVTCSRSGCITSYECGCNSTTFALPEASETVLCATSSPPLFPPDDRGGRSQRWVARQARVTRAPVQTRIKSKRPVVATATAPCCEGSVGSAWRTGGEGEGGMRDCGSGGVGRYCGGGVAGLGTLTVTSGVDLNVEQEVDGSTVSSPATPTTSLFRCPSGTCGLGCRKGLYCDEQFGRVASEDFGGGRSERRVAGEAEATAVAGGF